jgi:MYXO-CTERM domain-containing protein
MKERARITSHVRFSLLMAGLALPAVLGVASPARACGGFWCSQSAPVNQTGEEIIFAANPDGTVTCVIQISYTGPSQHFAWLLPVAGVPKVSVSSNIALQRLGQATEPQYVLERHVDGQCDQSRNYPTAGAGGSASGFLGVDAGVAPVQVLDQGSVGPYDYVTISVDPKLASPADAAINWLTGEGYDVVGISSSVLGPYLADGQNIIAFRLTKGIETGSIRPVVLTYPGDHPSIPIRPTAVAAQDDMGVLVWVLSEHQAVPQNYRSLILNEALINWFNPLSNYNNVVTAAANEAGGQGFVTELARSSSDFSQTVFGPNDGAGLSQLAQQSFADPIDLIFAANNYYRGWDGWRESIAAAVTLPPGANLDDFGRNPNAYRGMAGVSVNAAVFLDHLRTDVVEPVQTTQQIIDSRPYLTRLYSTMSAIEMTVDPVFTFNADLAPVSNVHTAQLYLQCRPGIQEYQAPWRLVLPQGGTLVGNGESGSWPLSPGGSTPANRKIVQLSETGPGEVITDNTAQIASVIASRGGTTSPPTQTPPPPTQGVPIGGYDKPSPPTSNSAGCGCSVPGGRSNGALLAMLVLAASVVTRARRRRPLAR